MSNIDQLKQQQRKLAKALRAEAYNNDPNGGENVCEHWCHYLSQNSIGARAEQVISVYWPLGDELNPTPLLNTLHQLGHTMVLPVMLGAGKPLIFRQWQPGDELKHAGFGTREPADDKPALDPDISTGQFKASTW